MRLNVLNKIHQGHQGIVKCRSRARQSVWWPGISREMLDMVKSCRICAGYEVRTPDPLGTIEFPERPWQFVGIDFWSHENLWLSINSWLLLQIHWSCRYEQGGRSSWCYRRTNWRTSLRDTQFLKRSDPIMDLLLTVMNLLVLRKNGTFS